MDSVNNNTFIDPSFQAMLEQVESVLANLPKEASLAIGDALGNVADANDTISSLDLPKLPYSSGSGLSLDTIMDALQFDARKNAVRSNVDKMEEDHKEIQEINKKQLQEIADRIEKMKSKSIWDVFKKIFSWIGKIFSVIAAAVTTAVGVMTGNPLLIAGGVLLGVMAINSIVSEATDGKISIGAGIAALAKKCGASDEVAKWIGFAFELAITLTGVALSIAGSITGAKQVATMARGAAETAQNMAEAAGKTAEEVAKAATEAAKEVVKQTMGKVTQLTSLMSKISVAVTTVAEVGKGITNIGTATIEKKAALSKAAERELEAILEQIRQNYKDKQEAVEDEMKRINDLLVKVKNIVDDCVATEAVIVGVNPPTA